MERGAIMSRLKYLLLAIPLFAIASWEMDFDDDFASAISVIEIPNFFIYAGGTIANDIKKYNISNLSYVTNSASYGGSVLAIAIDVNFIYAGGAIANDIKKYNISDLSYVTNSASYGGTIRTLLASPK